MGMGWSTAVTQCITGKGAFAMDYEPAALDHAEQNKQIKLHHKGSSLMTMIERGMTNLDGTIKRHEDDIDKLTHRAHNAMKNMAAESGRREATKHIRARRNVNAHVTWLYAMRNNLQVFSHKIEQARLVGDTGRLVTEVATYMKEETMSSGIDPVALEAKMDEITDMDGLLTEAAECLSALGKQASQDSPLDMDDDELNAELDAIAMQIGGETSGYAMHYSGDGGGGGGGTREYAPPASAAHQRTWAPGEETSAIFAEDPPVAVVVEESEEGVSGALYPPVPVGHPPAIVRTGHREDAKKAL